MTEKYFRKGFGLKEEAVEVMGRDFHSHMVDYIRAENNQVTIGDTTLKLAKEFGFCYGVDRSVEYAYQTVRKFPDRTVYLTGEIIHNPYVNNRLIEMGVRFLSGPHHKGESVDDITSQDVVILPAFGVSIPFEQELRQKDCILVDTTCGSVLLVWKHVEKFSREGYTAIVHGKYYHEETIATVSRSADKFIVVLNEDEAKRVCDYIRKPNDKEGFLEYFAGKMSPGFDPDRDLQRAGVANQTTMLANESLRIAGMVKDAMVERYGVEEIDQHFRAFDTICSATQERQDAMIDLFKEKIDLVLVIGGFNSSNTKSLTAIALEHCPAYHIESANDLYDAGKIHHLPKGAHSPAESENWLPDGKITIGITAGASTPNAKIGEVMEKLLDFRGEKIVL